MWDDGVGLVTKENNDIVVQLGSSTGKQRLKDDGRMPQIDDPRVIHFAKGDEGRHGIGASAKESFEIVRIGGRHILSEKSIVGQGSTGVSTGGAEELGESFVGHGPTKLEWMNKGLSET
jgi:hypothetical protein